MADPTLPGQDVATIVATSLENYKPKLIDSFSRNDAFFYFINRNERVDYEDGGYAITEPLLYAGNNTIKSYFPGEYLETERPAGFTQVKYGWAFVGGTIVIDGPTEFMNSGKGRLVNLVEGYIEQLKISFSQAMTDMFFADGTGNNGADLHGLELLIEEGSSWSTVGGIDSSTTANSFWRNYWEDADGSVWGTANGANAYGIQRLKHAIKKTSKPGYGKADALLTSLDQYELYEQAIAAKIAFNMPAMADKDYADAGFGGLRLDGVPVIYDESLDDHSTANTQNTWFVLNSKCLRLVIGKNKAFDVSAPIEHPLKDAKMMKARLYGQLTVRGRRDALGRVLLNAAGA